MKNNNIPRAIEITTTLIELYTKQIARATSQQKVKESTTKVLEHMQELSRLKLKALKLGMGKEKTVTIHLG